MQADEVLKQLTASGVAQLLASRNPITIMAAVPNEVQALSR